MKSRRLQNLKLVKDQCDTMDRTFHKRLQSKCRCDKNTVFVDKARMEHKCLSSLHLSLNLLVFDNVYANIPKFENTGNSKASRVAQPIVGKRTDRKQRV